MPTLATAYFWWHKPQNVAEPTIIKVDWLMSDLLKKAGAAARDPYVDTPMDFVEKPLWEGWRRRKYLLHFGGLEKRPLERIPNDYSPPPPTGREATVVWTISVVHAAVHVLGWSFDFPTEAETIIWRASSTTLLVVMITGGLVPVLSTHPWFDFSFSLLWIWDRETKKKTWIRQWMFYVIADLAYVVYIIARLLIFVEIFISFRALPEGAYMDINWTVFWPHLG